MATQNVRQTIALAADGQIQKYVKTVATTITKARIMAVQAQATAAGGSVKIYNEADDSKTASALVFHAKFSNADNHGQSFKIPGEGIYCNTGMYVDLTNCDFCTIIGTFT
jgi:hypothetical protein